MPVQQVIDQLDVSDFEFVGRKLEFRKFEEAWSKYKLFGIFGIRSVGKSRCVREYLKTKKCQVIYVELQYIDSIESLYSNTCALLGIKPDPKATETEKWIKQVISAVTIASKHESMVIFFDNAEDVIESQFSGQFLTFLSKLAQSCPRIKIFVTSTTRIQFTRFRFFTFEMEPLVESEAKELLQTIAPDVDLGEYGEVIVKLSEGLPLMILMIGAELKADEGLITPADMVELLCQCRLETLSNEFYPKEDRIGDVYRTFILRLSGEYQCHLIDLGYIPGSFNAVEACGLLELQKKYCKVFTEVMKKISIQMGTEEYTKAYSEFAVEQPNLQKLLGDVEYTKEDTYHFFIEIVSSYTTVIERFMTRESDTFYNACLRLTEMYGRSVDKAVVHLAVGSIETNTKGDFLHGANNYQSALEVLEKMEKSVHLASAYQKMGWNMHRQGLNVEAIQYYKKSLDQKGDSVKALDYHLQALDIKRRSKAPVTSLINSLSNVANAYNALERYKEAHALLDEAMTLISEQKIPMTDYEALIYNTRGKVCAKAADLQQAEEAFSKSVKLSKEISMKGFLLMKRMVSLAEVQERQGAYSRCMKTIKEAIKLKEESIKNLPHNTIVIECLECLAKVYKGTDDRLNYVQTLYDLETECLRLEQVYRQNSIQKLDKISETLWGIRQKKCNI